MADALGWSGVETCGRKAGGGLLRRNFELNSAALDCASTKPDVFAWRRGP